MINELTRLNENKLKILKMGLLTCPGCDGTKIAKGTVNEPCAVCKGTGILIIIKK